MKKLILTSLALLLGVLSLPAQNVGEVFYIFRNDGQFNAFFRSEVDSIVYSYEDADGKRYDDIVTQRVYTADSLYHIPLSAIDSVAFVTPPTEYKKDVVQLTGNLFDYVISVEGQVITLAPDVPKKLLPAVGDKIGTAELTDKIPYGFSGQVRSVSTDTNGNILVSCEEIPIEDVVDRLYAEFNAVSSDEAEEALRRRMPRAFKRTRIFKIDLPREIPMNADLSRIIKKKKVLDYAGAAKATLTLRPELIVKSTVVISRELGLYIKNVATLDASTTEDVDIVGRASTQDEWGKMLKKDFLGKTYQLAYGIGLYSEAGVKAEASGEAGIGGTFNQTWRSSLTVEFSASRPDMRTVSFDNRQLSREAHWNHVVGRAEVKVCGYIDVGFTLVDHKIDKVGGEFDAGLKIEAEAEVDIEALTQADRTTKLYDALEPVAKVDLVPYVGAYFKASVLDDRISFRAGHDWELGQRWLQLRLLPSFSDVKAEKTNTGAIASSKITNDMLLPTKVGFTAIDDEGTILPTVFKEDRSYWDRASFSSYKLPLTGLKKGHTYKIYPTVCFLGKWDMLASPYAELRTDVPVKITNFEVTKSQHKKDGFTYDGKTYSYRFDAATTVTLDDDAEVNDWGYVYEDPEGKQVHISLNDYASPYTDSRFVYYRNAAHSTVRFIPYMRYRADEEYAYADPVEFPLEYDDDLCPDENHPHAIDMGAAGIWACCNVGASSPTDYGGYYAWGETEQKSDYDWSTYKYYHENGDDWWYDDLGDISGNPQYDVAAKKWGGPWKMPTLERMKLLLSCPHEWTTINGVNGRLFTASNGHHIFLPAAGYRNNADLSYDGDDGIYWSSTPDPSYSFYAYYLCLFSNGANWGSDGSRSDGLSVRPVAE